MKKKRLEIILSLVFLAIVSYVVIAPFPSGTITLNNPTTEGANISRTVVLNVSISGLLGGTNVSNVSFYFNNGTASNLLIGLNTSVNLTIYSITWDTTATNVTEGGNFTINATATVVNQTGGSDAGNYSSTTTINVTIDNTAPTITINRPSNSLETNNTNITFNATIIDNVFTTIAVCNLTLDPTNSSNGANINGTTSILNATTIQFINTIAAGAHTWNITCQDNAGTNNVGSTATQSLRTGDLSSEIAIRLLDNQKNEVSKIGATDTIKIECKRNDNDGWNLTEIDVKFPQDSTFSRIQTIVEPAIVNGSRTVEVDFDQTVELGDYVARCQLTDKLGVTNSTNATFTVETKVKAGTSAFANKKFQPPIAKIKINTGTTSDIGKLTSDGVSRLMQENGAIKFDIEGEEHKLVIKEIKAGSVVVTISSEPFDITLNTGETKNVDVNQDGKNDIAVTFHKIFGKHADVTVKAASGNVQSEDIKGAGTKSEDEEDTKPQVKISSVGNIIVIIIVVVVVAIVGYILIKGKKR
ncbi:MAG: hypothetical protein AABW64_00660 [Nanoarchaeota archaeon]